MPLEEISFLINKLDKWSKNAPKTLIQNEVTKELKYMAFEGDLIKKYSLYRNERTKESGYALLRKKEEILEDLLVKCKEKNSEKTINNHLRTIYPNSLRDPYTSHQSDIVEYEDIKGQMGLSFPDNLSWKPPKAPLLLAYRRVESFKREDVRSNRAADEESKSAANSAIEDIDKESSTREGLLTSSSLRSALLNEYVEKLRSKGLDEIKSKEGAERESRQDEFNKELDRRVARQTRSVTPGTTESSIREEILDEFRRMILRKGYSEEDVEKRVEEYSNSNGFQKALNERLEERSATSGQDQESSEKS